MSIRNATRIDVPEIVSMGLKFYGTTHYRRFANFCPDTVAALATMLIEQGICLMAEDDGRPVGMVGLVIAPFMFNKSRKAAYEIMWWVDPTAQGAGIGRALLEAIEPACSAAGCAAIQMVRLASSPPQARELYERCGYESSEFSHTKILQ